MPFEMDLFHCISTQYCRSEHDQNTIGTEPEHYWNRTGTFLEHYWKIIRTKLEQEIIFPRENIYFRKSLSYEEIRLILIEEGFKIFKNSIAAIVNKQKQFLFVDSKRSGRRPIF